MKQYLPKAVFLAAVVLLASSGAATSVINTGEWQSYAKAQNHADINGEETFTIVTPSDAQIAENTVEDPETLYRSPSPTVSDLQQRTDLEFDDEKLVTPEKISHSSEGYVVVSDSFGTDAAAVLPYAARNNYSLVYYREGLELEEDKPKLFYGNFEFDPSDRFSETDTINGTWQERNLELASRFDTEWAVVTPRTFVDPELVGERPFLFKMNAERLADFLDSSEIDKLKIKGSQNVLYGKRLDILTDKELRIVVKTGRAFTGISDYRGVYGLKKIDLNYRRYSLELSEVKNFNSSINAVFVNRGNTERNVEAYLTSGNRTEKVELTLPSFSSIGHTFEMENVTDPEINYSTDRGTGSYSFDSSNISSQSEGAYSIQKTGVNRTEDRVELRLSNSGEEDGWVMVQTETGIDRKQVEAGQTADFSFSTNRKNISLYTGPFRNQYAYSKRINVEGEPEPFNPVPYVLAVLLIGSSILFLYRSSLRS